MCPLFSWYLQIKGLAGTALHMWIIPKSTNILRVLTKGPVCPLTPDCDLTHMMVEEQKVRRCVCWEEERECVLVCAWELGEKV